MARIKDPRKVIPLPSRPIQNPPTLWRRLRRRRVAETTKAAFAASYTFMIQPGA